MRSKEVNKRNSHHKFINNKRSAIIKFIIRLAISLVLLGFLISKIDPGSFTELIQNASLPVLFVAFSLLLADRFLQTFKWQVLVNYQGMTVSFSHLVKILFVSNFFGLFIPSNLSIDFIRAYRLSQATSQKVNSVSSVIIDRFISLASLLLLAQFGALAVLFYYHQTKIGIAILTLGMFFLITLRIIQYAVVKEDNWVKRIAQKWEKVRGHLAKLATVVNCYQDNPNVLVNVFFLSMGSQIVRIVFTYLMAVSLGYAVSIYFFFILVPVVLILAMLPISIGGLGVREGVFVVLLSNIGITYTEAMTLSLLTYFVALLVTLPGAFIFISDR